MEYKRTAMDTNKTPSVYNLLAQAVNDEIKQHYKIEKVTPGAFKKFCNSKGLMHPMTHKSFARLLKGDVTTPDNESVRIYLKLIGLNNIEEFQKVHLSSENDNDKIVETAEIISTTPNYSRSKPKSKKQIPSRVLIPLIAIIIVIATAIVYYSKSEMKKPTSSNNEVVEEPKNIVPDAVPKQDTVVPEPQSVQRNQINIGTNNGNVSAGDMEVNNVVKIID